MNTRALAATIAALAVVATTLTGCGGQGDQQAGNAPLAQEQQAEKKAPTADDLHTDMNDPDEVANHFVTIIETHDGRTDKDEWSSLHRAEKLMTKELASSETDTTVGDKDSPWPSWVADEAFVTPSLERNQEPTPKNTAQTHYLSLVASLDPVSTVTGKQLTPCRRVHYLSIAHTPDGWKISRWHTTPITSGGAEVAGGSQKGKQ